MRSLLKTSLLRAHARGWIETQTLLRLYDRFGLWGRP